MTRALTPAEIRARAKREQWTRIRGALERTLNRSAAAALLGVDPRQVRRWIAADPSLVAGLAMAGEGRPAKAR